MENDFCGLVDGNNATEMKLDLKLSANSEFGPSATFTTKSSLDGIKIYSKGHTDLEVIISFRYNHHTDYIENQGPPYL